MNTEHDLTTRLSREAERFDRLGGRTLEIGGVLDRAGEIRRGRRMRATIVMAAAVLAVAVPTALVATRGSVDKPVTPAQHHKVDSSPLTLAGLEQGGGPRIAYVQSGALHRDDFVYRSKGEQYSGVAVYDGGVMLAVRDDEGNLTAHVLGTGPKGSWPMSGSFAVSDDGTVVAFVQPDGTPIAIQGDASYRLPRIRRGTGFTAVAVIGEDCGQRSGTTGCAVWVNSSGQPPETWVSLSGGLADQAQTPLRTVTDVDGDTVAGITDVRDDLSTCSAVASSDESTPRWTTCDVRFMGFSPDAKHLLASGTVGSGIGDSELAVLDASSGEVELRLRTAEQAFVHQMVWEDDTHILATVFQGGTWAVLRVGLDGSREYAVPPTQGEDVDSPFVLATR